MGPRPTLPFKLLLFIAIATLPVFGKQHPVALDKNADSAKCLECHEDKTKGKAVHSAIAMGLVTNLYRNPDLSINGPYALCGKCHSLSNIMLNTSFSQHQSHINVGFSCSTCHTAHGMGGTNPHISGQRLVNFDVNVVAQNGAAPITYNRATNTCVLACHQTAHNPNGSVTAARSNGGVLKKRGSAAWRTLSKNPPPLFRN